MKIAFSNFDAHTAGLKYGFSSRKDGSMHRHRQKENRERYFKGIGIDPQKVVAPDLVHGTDVVKVGETFGGKLIPDTDAIITDTKGLFLSATGADCPPVLFYDPARPAAGIAHAGWRGTLNGVVPNVVKAMKEEFQAKPENMLAGICPGIRKCHFDLKIESDALRFEKEYPDFVSRQGERMSIDLPGIIKEQLIRSGLRPENIEDSGLCTFCDPEEYFSYRRDRPEEVDSMVAYIGLQ